MIVSPRVPARTETGATRRTCRYAKPRQRLQGKPRYRLQGMRSRRLTAPRRVRRPTPRRLRLARSRKRRPISRRCAPHWPISTAARSSGPPHGLSLRTASPARGSCSSAKPRERMKIGSGGRSSEGRGNCWIACWGRSDWIGRQSMSPMSFPGALQAIERRRLRRRRSVCLSSSGRSTSPIRKSWSVLADPRFARFWASRQGSRARGAHGLLIRARTAAKSGPSPCSIRRSCCGNRRISDLRGRTCGRSPTRSKFQRVEEASRRR